MVILSADEYDSILETLDILNDPDLVAAIREGMDDLARGAVYSAEEVEAELKALGRLKR